MVNGGRWTGFGKKLAFAAYLFGDIFRRVPARVAGLGRHFGQSFAYVTSPVLHGLELRSAGRILLWWGELLFLLLDLSGIPEWYEIGNLWLKNNARPLRRDELTWAKSIFGETLPYHRIRIDEKAQIGPRQYRFCYVSFCLVNSWQEMPPAILIHELVHIWQFQQYGSPYMLRALLAQRSAAGYDYGGLPALRHAKANNLDLLSFNYEQQASIVEDFFCLNQSGISHLTPANNQQDLATYRYFMETIALNDHGAARKP